MVVADEGDVLFLVAHDGGIQGRQGSPPCVVLMSVFSALPIAHCQVQNICHTDACMLALTPLENGECTDTAVTTTTILRRGADVKYKNFVSAVCLGLAL